MSTRVFENMIGQTMLSILGAEPGSESMVSRSSDATFAFQHIQDCCESVSMDDVCGDVSDLIGSPLVQAEEVSSEDAPPPPGEDAGGKEGSEGGDPMKVLIACEFSGAVRERRRSGDNRVRGHDFRNQRPRLSRMRA